MRRSPRCELAIDFARKAGARLGHANVTSADMIIGLLSLDGGVAAAVLRRAGLSCEDVERHLSREPRGQETAAAPQAFSTSAAAALTRAESEAARFRHSILGVEHLLLALLAEERGEAADLFAAMQIDREAVKQQIDDALQ